MAATTASRNHCTSVFGLVATLLCAGCEGQPLQVVNSFTTSQGSLLAASQDVRQEFGINEIVVALTYLTWPDVTRQAVRMQQTGSGFAECSSSPKPINT